MKLLWNVYLPFPFLSFLDGESKNSFKTEQKNRRGQVPEPGIIFQCHYSINGDYTVWGEDQSGYDGFHSVNKVSHPE